MFKARVWKADGSSGTHQAEKSGRVGAGEGQPGLLTWSPATVRADRLVFTAVPSVGCPSSYDDPGKRVALFVDLVTTAWFSLPWLTCVMCPCHPDAV